MTAIGEAFSLIFSFDSELYGIIGTTLLMSFFSTLISSLIGIPLGVLIGKNKFPGRNAITLLLNTMMGLPPVAAGLIVFMLFRAVGPLGGFHLMFSVRIMVIAQVILITPAVASLSAAAAGERALSLSETAFGLGIPRIKQLFLLLGECSPQFVGIVLMAFGRSIAEVGAVSLVGGNIQYKTRVMTTAILLETNKGNFQKALALGIILMLISLAVNIGAQLLKGRKK